MVRSQGTAIPPPVKHPKIGSDRRERPKTPGTKIPTMAPAGSVLPAGTPPKVGKGHRRTGKAGKGSTPDKTASSPAGQEGPAIPIPGGQEDTNRPGTAAQEGPASPIPGGQEDTNRPGTAAQEGPASHTTDGQEGTASHRSGGD
ncbi:hypothetical protein NDU88_001113 [Pleurodeles waltl]|uniref:Uncharacterized protein n=1 Tax=Pleurodeles waltl TaxID=8319 RepID=A0AAV7NCI0_PLEWA|nr:hypothetical protein NDU88_001113 [Pleurodeles waltl]